ncbi:TPA: hypothetical protein ACTYMW_004375 [Enterobacter hormaechei]
MQHIPANTRLTAVWPVSLQNQSGCRSISDDDLCAWCRHLCYRPGELSLCRLSVYLTASGPHGAMKMAMRSPARHSC